MDSYSQTKMHVNKKRKCLLKKKVRLINLFEFWGKSIFITLPDIQSLKNVLNFKFINVETTVVLKFS